MNNDTNAIKSLRTKYKSSLYSQFNKAINDYELINDGDHIAVCISGGKDSMVMALLFKELLLHGNMNFAVRYIVMNPGYSDENINKIVLNANALGLDIEIFDTDVFANSLRGSKYNPCVNCAKERRWQLYEKAEKLGCNKIALGHHMDDVIETVLMEMMYGGQFKTMLPKSKKENIELIRPMYLISEENIISFAKYNGLEFLDCACEYVKNSVLNEDGSSISKRKETKELIKKLKQINPGVSNNIFMSLSNVNLKNILGYKDDGGSHSFTEWYGNNE